jgi:hypothetical protein
MIINKETMGAPSMSTRPDENWMGEGWILVPKGLENKVMDHAPYCTLEFDGEGNLTDIAPTERPDPQPGPPDYFGFLEGLMEGYNNG